MAGRLRAAVEALPPSALPTVAGLAHALLPPSAEGGGSSEEEDGALLPVRSAAASAAAGAGNSALLQDADLVEVLSRVSALCAASLCSPLPWLAVLVAACAEAQSRLAGADACARRFPEMWIHS